MQAIVALLVAVATTWAPADQGTEQPKLTVLLATDGQVRPGQPLTFTVEVENSDEPATVTFPSGQLYDIAVLSGETEVWRWSGDRFFTMAVQQRTFPSGVTLLDRPTWDGRDSGGNSLPPGSYRAIATLSAMIPVGSSAVEVAIEAP